MTDNTSNPWPDGFMWGTGASSTQAEGASPASDWYDWERDGHAPISGDGNGFANRHAEDFKLYRSLGLTHHRLGIDWASLEPEPGKFDPAAVELYTEILSAARTNGVNPWVCLHHFTLPRWFANSGAFLVPENRTGPWRRYVDFVAETFGDLVAGWKPVNETNYYPDLAYRSAKFPPGHSDSDEASIVMEAIQQATAEAAVRLKQTGAPVSSIFGLTPFIAQDASDPTREAVAKLYEHHWDTGLGLFRDGVLRVPGRAPIERPDLAGSFDMIGFSYYAGAGIKNGHGALHPEGAQASASGYGIWPEGLGVVLDKLHEQVPGTPLLIAEYGIGTDNDAERAEYLRRGLELTADALARGIDVRGFFHWTGVDNYEWIHGMDVKFGIVGTDRQPKPSARVLAEAALSTMPVTQSQGSSWLQ